MNRIITILVTIFILLLLYIWISHVWGSDNPRHPKPIVDATEHELDEGPVDADTSVRLSTDLLSEEPSITAAAEEQADEPARTDEFNTDRKIPEKAPASAVKTETQKPVESKKVETVAKPLQKTETPPKSTTTKSTSTEPVSKPATTTPKTNTAPAKPVSTPVTSDAGGKHLVIAGNFSQKSNAEQRVNELKRAGFSDAEVVNFDLSEYHTVCAGRFSDVNEARKLVKKLKDYHKIDAYVRIGS